MYPFGQHHLAHALSGTADSGGACMFAFCRTRTGVRMTCDGQDGDLCTRELTCLFACGRLAVQQEHRTPPPPRAWSCVYTSPLGPAGYGASKHGKCKGCVRMCSALRFVGRARASLDLPRKWNVANSAAAAASLRTADDVRRHLHWRALAHDFRRWVMFVCVLERVLACDLSALSRSRNVVDVVCSRCK